MEIVEIIGAVILMLGVILIYDARPITRKVFSFGDQNEAVAGMKIIGFVFSVIGGFMMMV